MRKSFFLSSCAAVILSCTSVQAQTSSLDTLIAQHAAANDVPVELVHRVVKRESNYNPAAVGRGGALGLMQIKHATARGMGYTGTASGLLDANTNLAYAVPYLAGAYRVAGGNQNRAVAYYASGYYYAAKRQGLTAAVARRSTPASPATAVAAQAAEPAAVVRVEASAEVRHDMR